MGKTLINALGQGTPSVAYTTLESGERLTIEQQPYNGQENFWFVYKGTQGENTPIQWMIDETSYDVHFDLGELECSILPDINEPIWESEPFTRLTLNAVEA